MTARDLAETIVVSGLPRSGTSMMMRMIIAGGVPPLLDDTRPPDTDNPLGYFEFDPVKRTRDDPSWLERSGGRVVKIIHVLLRDLPAGRRYAVVMMQRDLDEVIVSQRKMLDRAGRAGARLAPEVLKKVFAAQVSEARRGLEGRRGFRLLDVRYDRVLADPRGEALRVGAFLGLDSVEAMAAAVEPSLYRSRRGTV